MIFDLKDQDKRMKTMRTTAAAALLIQ